MPLNISAHWHQPISLRHVNANGLIYDCDALDRVPDTPGVYLFGRWHGNTTAPLYIGRSNRLRTRLCQHLESVRMMMAIRDAPTGPRFYMCAEVEFRRRQNRDSVLRVFEDALMAHALADGWELINEQGTKRPNHTINFTGNRTSEAIAPRFMRVRAW